MYAVILDTALAYSKLLVNSVVVFFNVQLSDKLPTHLIFTIVHILFRNKNAGEVAQMQSGGECDGFRALAAVSPSCLATVVKSNRTWIPMLRFHPPA